VATQGSRGLGHLGEQIRQRNGSYSAARRLPGGWQQLLPTSPGVDVPPSGVKAGRVHHLGRATGRSLA